MKERAKSGSFRCNTLRGGVLQGSAKKCYNSIFPYLSHSSVALPCHSASAAPKEQNRGGR